MATVYKVAFRLRRGTLTEWETKNPILGSGEPGFVIDKFKLKIGNGTTAWNDLPYTADFDIVHPIYSIIKDPTSSDYSAIYHLTKDGKNVGAAINIPKDMVVKSGTVETKTTAGVWGEAGTYLHLILANTTEDNIYIDVGDLIEYITAGDSPDGMVIVTVSDDHKVTATLGNASITEAKLAKTITDKLAKAVSSVQQIATGTTNGTISVDGNSVAVFGLKDAAYSTKEEIAQLVLTMLTNGDEVAYG